MLRRFCFSALFQRSLLILISKKLTATVNDLLCQSCVSSVSKYMLKIFLVNAQNYFFSNFVIDTNFIRFSALIFRSFENYYFIKFLKDQSFFLLENQFTDKVFILFNLDFLFIFYTNFLF